MFLLNVKFRSVHSINRTCSLNVLQMTTLDVKQFIGFDIALSYSDDLQTYTYQKHVSDICFKANKIHLKTGRFFFGVIIYDRG